MIALIAGGEETVVAYWPWQVGFVKKEKLKKVFCGGTLIDINVIVTAAHCFDRNHGTSQPSELAVRMGNTDLNTIGKLFSTERYVLLLRILWSYFIRLVI